MKKLVLMCLILGVFSSCGASSPEQGGDAGTDPNANPDRKRSETANERTIFTGSVSVPTNSTLTLTVPKMGIQEATVPTATGTDEQQMENSTAIHLEGTGFPWEQEANVYILGKRLGDKGSPSYRAFYDIDELEDGDEIYIIDANGQEYPYKVFKVSVVAPTDLYVTNPTPSKNIVTLQTCTLPDCSNRVIAQGELDYDSVPHLVQETNTGEQ